ncbi:MAG: GNAT family N-acetyltransferase [Parvibaculaceae bacterium]
MAKGAPLRLRLAAHVDVELLSDLAMRSKASHGYDGAFLAQCREELAIHPHTLNERDVWIAEKDAAIIGFFALEPPKDGVCEVNPIFVEPRLQQAGVGRRLWRKLEERARFAGASAVGLDSDPHAVGFYEKMGCRMTGWSPSGSIPGRLLPRMEKRLDQPPELPPEEAHREQSRKRIIATAKQMLAGKCSFIDGSRVISDLLSPAGIDRLAKPFVVFVAIESQTDHIPTGSLRDRWHTDALGKLGPEWAEWEAWARQDGEAACNEIIAILSAEAKQSG